MAYGDVGQAEFVRGADGEIYAIRTGPGEVVPIGGRTVLVSASRVLTDADNGATLEVTADGITLTVPEGLSNGQLGGFTCTVLPFGTTSVARSGTALLNGAGTTLTRAAASNLLFAIVQRASALNSYVVNGS